MAKQLPLPDCPYTIAYDVLVKTMKADPLLRRTVKTWLTFTDEADQPADSSATYPSVMMYGAAQPATPFSQIHQDAPFGVTIILRTDGMDLRDNLNLWGAISNALFKGDGLATLNRATKAAVQGKGADFNRWRIMTPPISPVADPRTARMVETKGILIADMHVKQ
jgi:hypothetical protein